MQLAAARITDAIHCILLFYCKDACVELKVTGMGFDTRKRNVFSSTALADVNTSDRLGYYILTSLFIPYQKYTQMAGKSP